MKRIFTILLSVCFASVLWAVPPPQNFSIDLETELTAQSLKAMQNASQQYIFRFTQGTNSFDLSSITSVLFKYSDTTNGFTVTATGSVYNASSGMIQVVLSPLQLATNTVNTEMRYRFTAADATSTLCYAYGPFIIEKDYSATATNKVIASSAALDWNYYTNYANTVASGPVRAGTNMVLTLNADGSVNLNISTPDLTSIIRSSTNVFTATNTFDGATYLKDVFVFGTNLPSYLLVISNLAQSASTVASSVQGTQATVVAQSTAISNLSQSAYDTSIIVSNLSATALQADGTKAITASAINFDATSENNFGFQGTDIPVTGQEGASTWFGRSALYGSTGAASTAFGAYSLNRSLGSSNAAFGFSALNLSSGSWNTAIGHSAGRINTGHRNTSVGFKALMDADGNDNVGVGYLAGDQSKGETNLFLGVNAGASTSTYTNYTNCIVIGGNVAAKGSSTVAIGLPSHTTYVDGRLVVSNSVVSLTNYFFFVSSTNWAGTWADYAAFYHGINSNGTIRTTTNAWGW